MEGVLKEKNSKTNQRTVLSATYHANFIKIASIYTY